MFTAAKNKEEALLSVLVQCHKDWAFWLCSGLSALFQQCWGQLIIEELLQQEWINTSEQPLSTPHHAYCSNFTSSTGHWVCSSYSKSWDLQNKPEGLTSFHYLSCHTKPLKCNLRSTGAHPCPGLQRYLSIQRCRQTPNRIYKSA